MQPEEQVGPGASGRLQHTPDEPERGAGEKREDEQVREHEAERRISLRGDVNANEEPEPVTADADQQRAEVPQLRQDGRRGRCRCREHEYHDGGRDDEGQKTVHRQQVGDPAPPVAEFARHKAFYQNRPHREGHHFPGPDTTRPVSACIAPVAEEILGAFLVKRVVYRAGRHQEDHHDNISLHDSGSDGPRKRGERIGTEHETTSTAVRKCHGISECPKGIRTPKAGEYT